MWEIVVSILVLVSIYLFWSIKVLENHIKLSKKVMRFQISPEDEVFELPIMKELIDLTHGKGTNIYEEKFCIWRCEVEQKLTNRFMYFPDKDLIFYSNSEHYSSFIDFPYRGNDLIRSEELLDDGQTQFEYCIYIRSISDIPVFTGVLKKSIGLKTSEFVILFDVPFIFSDLNFLRDEKNKSIILKMEEHFGLKREVDKYEYINDGGATDDFGNLKPYHRSGIEHKNKYFTFSYGDGC